MGPLRGVAVWAVFQLLALQLCRPAAGWHLQKVPACHADAVQMRRFRLEAGCRLLAGHLLLNLHAHVQKTAAKPGICILQVSDTTPDLGSPPADYYTASMLWTFLYAKLHGYTYNLIIDKREYGPEDARERHTWLKAHNLGPYLENCDTVVVLDLDAVFTELSVSLEDKLVEWNFTDRALVLQALDPDSADRVNYIELADGRQQLNGNTGFMVLRGRNAKVQSLVKYWADCPEAVPGCEEHRNSLFSDQAAWNVYVRPQLTDDELILLPCDEANGHDGAIAPAYGCSGKFVSHFWNAKGYVSEYIWKKLATSIAVELASLAAEEGVVKQ